MSEAFAPVRAIVEVMAAFRRPWFVSGGWAIDLFVGCETREHHDLEIGLFFPDQPAVRRHLTAWTLFHLVDEAWAPLGAEEAVELPEFQIQARSSVIGAGEFDLFLNPRDGPDWVSRRHPGLRRSVRSIALRTPAGGRVPANVPFLAPEIQLLYKAKHHRPQDELDFTAAAPLLSRRRGAWLRAALEAHHPGDPWLARL